MSVGQGLCVSYVSALIIYYYCFDYELTPFNVLVKLLRSELLIGIELLSMKFCVDVISCTCFQRTMIWFCMENILHVLSLQEPCLKSAVSLAVAGITRRRLNVKKRRSASSDFRRIQSHVRSGYVSY